MMDWLAHAAARLATDRCLVRVTVIATRGSVPRDTGTSMLVGEHWEWGTIGGGHLEWDAIRTARGLMAGAPAFAGLGTRRDRYALGASLGQCCGGAVELALERFERADREFLEEGLALREKCRPLVLACRWRAGQRIARSWIRANEPGRTIDLGLERGFQGGIERGFEGGLESERAIELAWQPDVHHADAPSALADPLRDLLADTPCGPRARLLSNVSWPAVRATGGGAQSASARDDLWLERADHRGTPLWIFGAGHVARALMPVLAPLPFDIHWIDSREQAFSAGAEQHSSLRQTWTEDPASEVRDAPASAFYLVMTHDHELDFAICRHILERGDFARLGLIGSATKARRFRQRLSAQGVSARALARLTSPIGIGGIQSKLPAAIAVSVAAQLLQWQEETAAGQGQDLASSATKGETTA